MPLDPEWPIVRARAAGELSAEASFEKLHALYGATVLVWLRMEVGARDAEDLCQDVWTIFFRRWERWDDRLHEPAELPIVRVRPARWRVSIAQVMLAKYAHDHYHLSRIEALLRGS